MRPPVETQMKRMSRCGQLPRTSAIRPFISRVIYMPRRAMMLASASSIARRGMYITREMKGRIAEVLALAAAGHTFHLRFDGRPHLGLGDIGANGMGIPIASCNSIRRARRSLQVPAAGCCSILARPTRRSAPIRSILAHVRSPVR